jgi:undecaprenyl-diphosphatase
MGIFEAVILGIVEGLTEFLPVSSTGHLTITEKIMGLPIDRADITAFTAIIQCGAIAATLVYFRGDIWRILSGWVRGVFKAEERGADYRFGWAVILGTIPIGIVGFLFKDQVETTLRSLWFVAAGLIIWSFVMAAADRAAKQTRHEKSVTWKDTLFIGIFQCLALIPGVSRSGATMSAGLFRGLDRVAVTRLSFFLAIPALVAAGLLETATKASDISAGVGWTATIVATVISFFVAYASIAWLLKYVSRHNFSVFIVYRLALGGILVILLITGVLSAT